MKSKVLVLAFCAIILTACANVSRSKNHIEKNYMDHRGIVLNYKNAVNPQYLSESMGLYMQYLLESDDAERFGQQVDILLEYFVVAVDDFLFIRWELGENTTVGAFIDDLRIAWVLGNAAVSFGEERYYDLSDKILNTIKNTMIVDGRPADFFDWHYNIPKDQFFLSYYIIPAMGSFPDSVFVPLEQLSASPFFFEIYINGEFAIASEEEINMIDQSLIAVAYFQRVDMLSRIFRVS